MTTTPAGGTHPTGMHSCYIIQLYMKLEISKDSSYL